VYNDERHDLRSLLNIIWKIKFKKLGWAGNVTLWAKGGMDTGCWWGNLKERDYLQDTDVDRTVTLKQMGGRGLASCGQVLMAGF